MALQVDRQKTLQAVQGEDDLAEDSAEMVRRRTQARRSGKGFSCQYQRLQDKGKKIFGVLRKIQTAEEAAIFKTEEIEITPLQMPQSQEER